MNQRIKVKRRTARPGFTLVEMVVATILLLIGVTAVLAAISASQRAAYAAEHLQTAALLAQQQMTEIELQASSLSATEQDGDFGDEYREYHWHETVEGTDYTALYKVTLVVQWGKQIGQPNDRTFTTYIVNPTAVPTIVNGQNGTSTGTGSTSGGTSGK